MVLNFEGMLLRYSKMSLGRGNCMSQSFLQATSCKFYVLKNSFLQFFIRVVFDLRLRDDLKAYQRRTISLNVKYSYRQFILKMILRECKDNNLRFGVEEILKFELDSKVLNGVVELAFVDLGGDVSVVKLISYRLSDSNHELTVGIRA